MRYRWWRQRAGAFSIVTHKLRCRCTYNLELDRYQTEVDDLHRWPDQEVGLERWHVDILELARHSALPTAFGNGHECEEARQTSRCEQELVERNALQRRHHGSRLRNGKCPRQEPEPLVLDRCHQETVRHETCQTLKVEGRRESLRVGDDLAFWPWVPLVQLVYFDGEEVVLVAFAHRTLPYGRQGLCYSVCYATKNLYTSANVSNCVEVVVTMGRKRCVSSGGKGVSGGRTLSYRIGYHGGQHYISQHSSLRSLEATYPVFSHSSY
jgi:hypothetical protein